MRNNRILPSVIVILIIFVSSSSPAHEITTKRIYDNLTDVKLICTSNLNKNIMAYHFIDNHYLNRKITLLTISITRVYF